MDSRELEDRYLIPMYAKREISLDRGDGCYVVDQSGRRYLDMTSQYGAASLGYAHPKLIAALCEQAGKIQSVHKSFYTEKRGLLAQKLVEVVNVPDSSLGDSSTSSRQVRTSVGMTGHFHLSKVYFCSTGTETIEAAIKFARAATGKTDFVSFKRAYHGRTIGALSATPVAKYQDPFMPLVPGFTSVSFNDLEAVRAVVTDKTSGIIVEVVQGEGGIFAIEQAVLEGLRDICDERGCLLIIDEVQSGSARTGRWCAWHHFGVKPDILCLSKAMAGGIPLGATIVTEAVSEKLPKGSHGSTFGGNPLSAAAGLAFLEIVESEGLLENVLEMGTYLLRGLRSLQLEKVRDVRGMGLMVGVELKVKTDAVMKALQENGVIVQGASGTVIRLLPPYIVSKTEIDEFLEVFGKVMRNV